MPLSFISLSIVLLGIAMWLMTPSSLFGYLIGLVLGVSVILSLVRKLGKKSQKSLTYSSLFFKLTRHRATVYNIVTKPYADNITVYGNGDNDYNNMLDVLKRQMKFNSATAIEATKHALSVAHGSPLQEKLTVALRYIDSNNNHQNTEKNA